MDVSTKIKMAPSVDKGCILIRILATISIYKGLKRIKHRALLSVYDSRPLPHFNEVALILRFDQLAQGLDKQPSSTATIQQICLPEEEVDGRHIS